MLTEKEAARFLDIDEKRLGELVSQKVIPGYMIAGEYLRFKKEELETLKEMLKQMDQGGDERIFNKSFSKVTGIERFKEVLRANDIYIILGAAVLLIFLFMMFKSRM
jgi:excisionase family DNA binding protein